MTDPKVDPARQGIPKLNLPKPDTMKKEYIASPEPLGQRMTDVKYLSPEGQQTMTYYTKGDISSEMSDVSEVPKSPREKVVKTKIETPRGRTNDDKVKKGLISQTPIDPDKIPSPNTA